MNNALNKYGKVKWLNTRLSRPHKTRRSIAVSQCASIKAQAWAQVSEIKASGDKSEDAIRAMGRITINAAIVCASIMRGVK